MFDIHRFAAEQAVPIVESGHPRCHRGWAQMPCPFCGGSDFYLGFSLNRGNLNCWRCGGHSLREFVGLILRTNEPYLIKKEIARYQTDHHEQYERKPKEVKARRRRVKPPPGLGPLRDAHKRYLRSRRFSPKRLTGLWRLRGTAHLSGEWNWRLIFPIMNLKGETVAYKGRGLSDKAMPRYKMTDDEDCSEDPKGFLYGIHNVPGDRVLVVEGATDVWRMGPGSVGTLGIDWTTEQANVLRQFDYRYILYDPEPQAQAQALKLGVARIVSRDHGSVGRD